jgi:hypothetical protein
MSKAAFRSRIYSFLKEGFVMSEIEWVGVGFIVLLLVFWAWRYKATH